VLWCLSVLLPVHLTERQPNASEAFVSIQAGDGLAWLAYWKERSARPSAGSQPRIEVPAALIEQMNLAVDMPVSLKTLCSSFSA
jgi:hypothetical protein